MKSRNLNRWVVRAHRIRHNQPRQYGPHAAARNLALFAKAASGLIPLQDALERLAQVDREAILADARRPDGDGPCRWYRDMHGFTHYIEPALADWLGWEPMVFEGRIK